MPQRAQTNRSTPPPIRLGFVPLCDCAPLMVAQEYGFFADEGLTVTLSRESSWAAIRDKVALGLLDGAQMLAGLPLASTLGLGSPPYPMVTALSLSLNGNAITLSNRLFERMQAVDSAAMTEAPRSARALQRVIAADREAGLAPLTLAMVHPVSSHNYQLRYWLAAAGIDPDRDLRLIVVPPSRMVANLEAGRIDGYCVGAPWNQAAVAAGLGQVAITGHAIWNNAPEKVFGVGLEWAQRCPDTHRALLRALLRACCWLDVDANRDRVFIERLASTDYVGADPALVAAALGRAASDDDTTSGRFLFHRRAANFPWRSHALWLLAQMVRWHQLPSATDLAATAAAVYDTQLHREIAGALAVPLPPVDAKAEGRHAAEWTLGPVTLGADRFLDGRVFEPDAIERYLATPERYARRPEEITDAADLRRAVLSAS